MPAPSDPAPTSPLSNPRIERLLLLVQPRVNDKPDLAARGTGRASLCVFGPYTAVALLYLALPEAKQSGWAEWPGQSGVTCSDPPMAARRWLSREWVFPQAGLARVVQKLSEPVQDLRLYDLAPAA